LAIRNEELLMEEGKKAKYSRLDELLFLLLHCFWSTKEMNALGANSGLQVSIALEI